jgi:tetratricopeptide (TPR) repeat protein
MWQKNSHIHDPSEFSAEELFGSRSALFERVRLASRRAGFLRVEGDGHARPDLERLSRILRTRTHRSLENPYGFNSLGSLRTRLKQLKMLPDDSRRLAEDLFYEANHDDEADRKADAVHCYDQALSIIPEFSSASYNRGVIFLEIGIFETALESFDLALKSRPDHANSWNNRGNVLHELGRFSEAIQSFTVALNCSPQSAEFYHNRANSLYSTGDLDGALADLETALAIRPDGSEYYVARGNIVFEKGLLYKALEDFELAIIHDPDNFRAELNKAVTLIRMSRLTEAEHVLRDLASVTSIHRHLAIAYRGLIAFREGKIDESIEFYVRSLELQDSLEARVGFCQVIKLAPFEAVGDDLRALLLRAFDEVWSAPLDMAQCLTRVITNDVRLHVHLTTLSQGEIFGDEAHQTNWHLALQELSRDPLVLRLLAMTVIPNVELESVFTAIRRYYLDQVSREEFKQIEQSGLLNFYTAVARQCFINEYIYPFSEQEKHIVADLRAKVELDLCRGATPTQWSILCLALYMPLYELKSAEKLLQSEFSAAIIALIRDEIETTREEELLKSAIQKLTPITNRVSQMVRSQYEENPYPRWVELGRAFMPVSLKEYLQSKFPHLVADDFKFGYALDALVAGCGTGRHPIALAESIPDLKILAIDLSLASLGYALRKANERQVGSIHFAQADLLALSSIPERFDVIECVGVLHHLDQPDDGMAVLSELLKKGAYMRIGLYSDRGRIAVRQATEFVKALGFGLMLDDIRSARQAIIAAKDQPFAREILQFTDFYSMSECRDLLFHVQEHRFTIPEIAAMLERHKLQFIGFEGDTPDFLRLQSEMPHDSPVSTLAAWHEIEHDNPELFSAMYQFWVRKPVE